MEIKSLEYITLFDLLNEINCSSEKANSISDWLEENFSYGDDTLSFIYLSWILEEFQLNVERLNLSNNILIKI